VAILGLIALAAWLLPHLNDDHFPAWIFACGGSIGLVLGTGLALVGILLMSVGDQWGR
jgi:hypothetical protein